MSSTPEPINVYYVCAHEDLALLGALEKHLKVLQRLHVITTWHRYQIAGGDVISTVASQHFAAAKVILLLISPNFIASDYCYSNEMERALQRHRAGTAQVIPVLFKKVDIRGTPIADLQALPGNGKPVTLWSDLDEALASVAAGIREAIEQKPLSIPPTADEDKRSDNHTSENKRSDSHTSNNSDTASAPAPIGTLLLTHQTHSSYIVVIDWEPHGSRIASAGGDGTVQVWDADTGLALQTYREQPWLFPAVNWPPTIYALQWSPQEAFLASAGVGTHVFIWDATTGDTRTLYEEHSGVWANVYAVTWSPDGTRIASACSCTGGDRSIHIWNAKTGKHISSLDASHSPKKLSLKVFTEVLNFSVLTIAWSPDGKYIAAACDDRTIRIWHADTGKQRSKYPVSSKSTTHLAWSPDNKLLASAHDDHRVRIWDTHTDETIISYHKHTDSVRHVAWSPDGRYIASASNDRTVQLWEARAARHIYTYRGHSHWATSATWSPDGTRVASASNDKTVQIWSAHIDS